MGEPIGVHTGRVLRRARLRNGLTLQGVGERSAGTFSPTAVAGYERGERRISLQRFCDLARLYDIRPELLLTEIMEAVDGVPDVIVVDVRTNEERAASDA